MDVLQLIKKQHQLLRELSTRLNDFEAISDKRKIFSKLSGVANVQWKIEADYLLPEVLAVDPAAERSIRSCEARHQHLRADLGSLQKVMSQKPQAAKPKIEKSSTMFAADLGSHLAAVEDQILPRIRQRISTQEREDLGEALSDVLADELEGLGIGEETLARSAAAV